MKNPYLKAIIQTLLPVLIIDFILSYCWLFIKSYL